MYEFFFRLGRIPAVSVDGWFQVTIHVEPSICFKVLKSVVHPLQCAPHLGSWLLHTTFVSLRTRAELKRLSCFIVARSSVSPQPPWPCPSAKHQPLASIEGTRKFNQTCRPTADVPLRSPAARGRAAATLGDARPRCRQSTQGSWGRHARLINHSRRMLHGAFL
jgi:hypothetical protein